MKYANNLTKQEVSDFISKVFNIKIKKIKLKQNGINGYSCSVLNDIKEYEFYYTDFYFSNPENHSKEFKQHANKCWTKFLHKKFGDEYAIDYNEQINAEIKDKTSVYLSTAKSVKEEMAKTKAELEEEIEQIEILLEDEPTCEIREILDEKKNELATEEFDGNEYLETLKQEYENDLNALKSQKISLHNDLDK